jgi:hypothetical protein
VKATCASTVGVVDDVDHLVDAVAVVAGELDEFARFIDDGAAFGSAGDVDAAAASELKTDQNVRSRVPPSADGATSRASAARLA